MGSSAWPGRKGLAASYGGTGKGRAQWRATHNPSQVGCSSLLVFREVGG